VFNLIGRQRRRQHRLVRGLAAGGLGTLALEVASYVDMAARARPASDVPGRVVASLAGKVGLPLAQADGEEAENRRSGLGALSGYATGLAVGVAFGLVRPRLYRVPYPLAAVAVGAAAMGTADVGAVALGAAPDPRTWGLGGWLADVVPHLVYGLVTVAAFDRLRVA
jgi:hypothetical protein